MQEDACKFHGKHRYKLSVTESCRGCGHVRRKARTSRVALYLVPAALCANAILLLALLVTR